MALLPLHQNIFNQLRFLYASCRPVRGQGLAIGGIRTFKLASCMLILCSEAAKLEYCGEAISSIVDCTQFASFPQSKQLRTSASAYARPACVYASQSIITTSGVWHQNRRSFAPLSVLKGKRETPSLDVGEAFCRPQF